MANPWTIGLGVLAVGVVGMMLVGGKSHAGQAAEAMPNLNDATRGKPVSVTFGTNRVYPQVVWTANFEADQNTQGKKGKGGGSGGFGSAKGGNTGGGYLYYWDMMFNFGIMDQPCMMIRGWVGGDRLDPLLIGDITAGGSTGWSAIVALKDVNPQLKTASIVYDESFFSQGYDTGDASLTSWAYFNSQIGSAYDMAFPSTAWVGFRRLKLGQSPAVPQLSFEFGPADVNIDITDDGRFLSFGPSSNATPNPGAFCYDASGVAYNVLMDGSGGVNTVRVHDGVAVNKTITVLGTDLQSVTGFGSFSPSGMCAFVLDGTQYVYLISSVNANGGYTVMLYLLQTDGTLTFRSASYYAEAQAPFGGNLDVGSAVAARTETDEMILAGPSAAFASSQPLHIIVFHSPAEIDTNSSIPGFSGPVGLRHRALSELGNNPIYVDGAGFNLTPGWVRHGFLMTLYYGPYVMDNVTGGYAKTLKDTALFPDGVVVTCEVYASAIDNTVTLGIYGPNNSILIDQLGNQVVPFSGTEIDRTTLMNDYGSPNQYGNYITMTRGYSSDFYKVGVRVGVQDPLSQHIIMVGQGAGHVGTSADYTPTLSENIHTQITPDGEIIVTQKAFNNSELVNGTFGFPSGQAADVTPAYVIYRILTSEIFGFATRALFGYTITTDRIDTISYQAAHDWCLTNGILISVTYSDQSNLLDVLKELLDLYNGFLVINGGVIQFGYVSGTYTNLRVIDNNHLVPDDAGKPPVSTTKAALEDGYNKILFNYLDRSIDYDQNQVEVEDPVDIDINGPRVKTYDAKFVMNGSVAMSIAKRALWSNLYGTDTYAFNVGWKDADVMVGDAITLVDSYDDILKTGVTARVTKWSPTRRGVFKLEARREFPHIINDVANFTQTTSMDTGFSSIVQSIGPMQMQTMYELPREFQGSKAYLYAGYAQSTRLMGAKLYLSTDNTNFVEAQDKSPAILSGRAAQALVQRPKGHVENGFEFYVYTKGNSFIQNFLLDDVSEAARSNGGGIIIVGSEAISLETLTLLGQNHYRAKYAYRGWGGTPIAAHNSGDFFHAHADGIFFQEISPTQIGQTFYYKIAGYNFVDQVYDVSSITAGSYKIKGDYWLPRQQPHTRVWVDSAISWPNSTAFQGQYVGVVSGGCDAVLTWPLHDNLEGYGAGGYGGSTYGHFSLADSVAWRVDVMSKNGSAVSSFFVSSPLFRYTRAQNSADFSGFGHDLIYKVTPYNNYGDGYVNAVRSLSLNY